MSLCSSPAADTRLTLRNLAPKSSSIGGRSTEYHRKYRSLASNRHPPYVGAGSYPGPQLLTRRALEQVGERDGQAAGLRARKVLGWPRRCELAHAFRWECSYKRLKLAQHLARHGASLTEEVKTEVGAFVGQIPDIRYIFTGGAAAANRTCICFHPGILRYVWCVD